jgi:UDP-N-acetylmuramoylalanine--D-glutamate ligase
MAEGAGLTALAGGNLGKPALDLLEQPVPDLYVLELSSFQLETTTSLELLGAALLNVTSDHMDRYASLAEYARAKARIFAHAATVVLNADDPFFLAMRRALAGRPAWAQPPRIVTFSIERSDADFTIMREGPKSWLARRGEGLLGTDRMKISGMHNAANALAALALGESAGLPIQAMLRAIEAFPGLKHRSEWVADIAGVRYIDDSKGTNVGATIAAVNGFPGPLVVIAGGDGKGQDFAPLAAAFRGKVKRAVLIGRDAPIIAEALAGVCTVERADTLPAAVAAAAAAAQPGDTVLLSPACASLDMFRDYNHRGEVFTDAVRALAVPA